MLYKCNDCRKKISENESLTYWVFSRNNFLINYKRTICKECSMKKLEHLNPEESPNFGIFRRLD